MVREAALDSLALHVPAAQLKFGERNIEAIEPRGIIIMFINHIFLKDIKKRRTKKRVPKRGVKHLLMRADSVRREVDAVRVRGGEIKIASKESEHISSEGIMEGTHLRGGIRRKKCPSKSSQRKGRTQPYS